MLRDTRLRRDASGSGYSNFTGSIHGINLDIDTFRRDQLSRIELAAVRQRLAAHKWGMSTAKTLTVIMYGLEIQSKC